MEPRMTPNDALKMLSKMTDADFETTDAAHDLNDGNIEQLVINGRRAWSGRPSLTAPGQHSPSLNLRVPEWMKRRLEAVAHAQGRRQSDVVREALDTYLAAVA